MKQKINLVLVMIAVMVFIFLYGNILFTGLRFESNKTLFNSMYFKQKYEKKVISEQSGVDGERVYGVFIENPAETELYLRSHLFAVSKNVEVNHIELSGLYRTLLKRRPSWPYYYSGIVQVRQLLGVFDKDNVEKAIKFGPHEKKVVKSVAEILFYNWDDIEKSSNLQILEYLSRQTDAVIASVVAISAKFAKIYEYCDFIYEKKHVEYAACKQQYWQPLSDQ